MVCARSFCVVVLLAVSLPQHDLLAEPGRRGRLRGAVAAARNLPGRLAKGLAALSLALSPNATSSAEMGPKPYAPEPPPNGP